MRLSEEQYLLFKKAIKEKINLLGDIKRKYHNKKVQYNGITFDSEKEYYRYLWLKVLEEEGKISMLELQKKFLLQEGFTNKTGKKQRPIYYIVDFFYYDKKLKCYIAEDVKSEITRIDKVYRLKKKMFEYQYPNIAFKEVI